MQEKIIIDDSKTVISITGTNSIVGMRKMFVIDNMRKQGYVLNEEILRHENCDGFLSLTCQLVFIKKKHALMRAFNIECLSIKSFI